MSLKHRTPLTKRTYFLRSFFTSVPSTVSIFFRQPCAWRLVSFTMSSGTWRSGTPLVGSPLGAVPSCVGSGNTDVSLKYSVPRNTNRSRLPPFALIFPALTPHPASSFLALMHACYGVVLLLLWLFWCCVVCLLSSRLLCCSQVYACRCDCFCVCPLCHENTAIFY